MNAKIVFKLNHGQFVFRQYPLLEPVPYNQVYHILLDAVEASSRRQRAICGYAPEEFAWKPGGVQLEQPQVNLCSKCEKLARKKRVLTEIVA